MDPFLALLLIGAAFAYVQTQKAPAPSSGGAPEPGNKPALVPEDIKSPRTTSNYYQDNEPRVQLALTRILADPLSAGIKSTSLPSGMVPRITSFGADAPMVAGERMTMDVVDAADVGQGALEGTFSGPYDPDEGPATLLVDRVASQHGTAFEVPGKYTIPASAKRGYHDRLKRVVWSVRDPSEKTLRGFEETFSVDPGDKVTVLLRDDYGTYVVGIAQVREIREGGVIRVLLLSPHAVLVDEGKGDVIFTRMLNQGLVDMKFSQLVDPKSLKKGA